MIGCVVDTAACDFLPIKKTLMRRGFQHRRENWRSPRSRRVRPESCIGHLDFHHWRLHHHLWCHKLLYFKFVTFTCVVSQKTWISQDSKIMCMQELAWVSKCKSKRRKEFNKTLGSFSLLFMSKMTCWFFHSKTNISELQFQNSRLPLYMEIKKKETWILLSWQRDRRWCRKSFG